MRAAERLASSRFGWLGALALVALIYLSVLYFDHFHAIVIDRSKEGLGPLHSFGGSSWIDGSSWSTTVWQLHSTKDLNIPSEFSNALAYSFFASAIVLFVRRLFSRESFNINNISIIFCATFVFESLFIIAYLVWYSLTHDTVAEYSGTRPMIVPLIHLIATSVGAIAISMYLFPKNISYSQYD